MSLMIPPAPPETFRVGAVMEGVVRNKVEFGLFVEFVYFVRGHRWTIDGLLFFFCTVRPDEARAWKCDQPITVVVTDWKPSTQNLKLSLPADPAWRTADVVALARGIAAEGAFDRMPILADALQEAGCTDDALLHRLRHAPANEVSWLIPLLAGEST